jgi:hypothetical protein
MIPNADAARPNRNERRAKTPLDIRACYCDCPSLVSAWLTRLTGCAFSVRNHEGGEFCASSKAVWTWHPWFSPRRFCSTGVYFHQCMNSLGWKKNRSLRHLVAASDHRVNILPPAFWTHHNSRLFVQGVLDVSSRLWLLKSVGTSSVVIGFWPRIWHGSKLR